MSLFFHFDITKQQKIAKLVLNNNTYYMSMHVIFQYIYEKAEEFQNKSKRQKIEKNSLKTEDLLLYRKTWQVCCCRSASCSDRTHLVYVTEHQPVAEHAPFAIDKDQLHMMTNEERIAVRHISQRHTHMQTHWGNSSLT